MNSDYSTAPRWQRLLAGLAASVVTVSLFGAVAFGLTGDEGWGLFARHDESPAQAAVRPA